MLFTLYVILAVRIMHTFFSKHEYCWFCILLWSALKKNQIVLISILKWRIFLKDTYFWSVPEHPSLFFSTLLWEFSLSAISVAVLEIQIYVSILLTWSSGSRNPMLTEKCEKQARKGGVWLPRTRSAVQIDIKNGSIIVYGASQLQSSQVDLPEWQVYNLYGDDVRRIILIIQSVWMRNIKPGFWLQVIWIQGEVHSPASLYPSSNF